LTFPNGDTFDGDVDAAGHPTHGTYNFSNSGDRYVGDMRNGDPDGRGMYIWKDGTTYDGDWVAGVREGHAVWKSAAGSVFVGMYHKNEPVSGALTRPNGERYEGAFAADGPHGTGKYFWPDGNRYEGPVDSRGRNGHGTMFFPGGDSLECDWKDDQRVDGHGRYLWANGEIYDGNFVNGVRDGDCTSRFPSGDTFAGQCHANKWVTGLYTWKDGRTYQGPFVDGVPTGHGKVTWPSHEYWEGEVHQVRNGDGVFHWRDGDRLEGHWVNDLAEGPCTYFFHTGNKFIGTCTAGHVAGRGVYVGKDGSQTQAEYQHGHAVSQGSQEIDLTSQAKGRMTIEPGNDYLVYEDIKLGVQAHWAIWGDKPFDIVVKGVKTLTGVPIPDPFDETHSADPNYGGVAGAFGYEGQNYGISLYLVVRTMNPHTNIRLKANFSGPPEIKIPIPPGDGS
jgi:hypothetical protein